MQYNAHLVNMIKKKMFFIEAFIAMMCEDPEEHKLIAR